MADGITPMMDHGEATSIMVAAKDRPRHDESPVVSAARTLIRDHERDPMDGTMRTFGGRDEGRLISAITRIDPQASNAHEIEGRLKADVAIQRMGAQRDRDIGSSKSRSSFDRRDLDAVRGDTLRIGGEMSHFTAGNIAMGRFDRAPRETREWIRDAVAFAGRDSATRNRDGVGDRMASIGGFMPGSGVRAQMSGMSASMERAATGRPASMGKGVPENPVVDQAAFLDRTGRGR